MRELWVIEYSESNREWEAWDVNIGDGRDDAERQIPIDKAKYFAATPAEFRVTRYLPADEPNYAALVDPNPPPMTEVEDRSQGIADVVRANREKRSGVERLIERKLNDPFRDVDERGW